MIRGDEDGNFFSYQPNKQEEHICDVYWLNIQITDAKTKDNKKEIFHTVLADDANDA